MRLLLAEDDPISAGFMTELLVDYDYVVDVVSDGESAWEQVSSEEYNVVLLDVMLPQLDGISLCRRMRANGHATPILMLTARGASSDRVLGLDAGADDYMVKPIDLPELLARIRALLRRSSASDLPELAWGKLKVNLSKYEAVYANQQLDLTPKEFSLLALFLQHGEHVLTRRAILGYLWSAEDAPGEHAVKAHIKTLRHKLLQVGAPSDLIETIRGIGYRLKSNI